MAAALRDEIHVHEQAKRYADRRKRLSPALESAGFTIHHSEAGLYIWCTREESDWDSVTWLAERGILATPGSFYGEAASRFIRIAMTATDAQIASAAERITSTL
jgi:aspartate/methionine/tyrosine aminotransferase